MPRKAYNIDTRKGNGNPTNRKKGSNTMKTVTHYDLCEAINEMNHRYEGVQFYNMAGILDRTVSLGVNWSAIGTVSPEKAEAFAEKLKAAAQEAKNFKYNGYTIVYGE